jgi:hypothetical protein
LCLELVKFECRCGFVNAELCFELLLREVLTLNLGFAKTINEIGTVED